MASAPSEEPLPLENTPSNNATAGEITFTEPSWTENLLGSLGLQRGEKAKKVLEHADHLATRLAPNTRRLWRWILLLEGFAVLLPICWLMVAQREWPGGIVAVAIALCTLGVVGFCWWMRWRNQQHLWTRSRLLAEFARSAEATRNWPGRPTWTALEMAPSLQPLLGAMAQPDVQATEADLERLKASYIDERIENEKTGQLEYFRSKAKQAAEERRRLTQYVTWSLDGALILAVLGLWLGFSNTAQWLFSVANSDLFLGLIGAGLPLIAILMQSLDSYLELNRRTGRFAQQWEFLDVARKRLANTRTLEEAVERVQEIERVLLAEVTEWFYQAEHAEVFYRGGTRSAVERTPRQALTTVKDSYISSMTTKVLNSLGLVLSFTGRIIFGRVVIVAITSVLTALLIFSRAPQDALQRSLLRTADGQLLSRTDKFGWWSPKKEEAERGFILIAHGLHDSAVREEAEKLDSGKDQGKGKSVGEAMRNALKKAVTPEAAQDAAESKKEKLHWMSEIRETIHQQLDPVGGSPDICLVDWSLAAKPSEVSGLLQSLAAEEEAKKATETPVSATAAETAPQANVTAAAPVAATDPVTTPEEKESLQQMVLDVTAIRSQAQAIGDTVAYKLVQAIKSNPPRLHGDKPMHLIGHSAGGFLVVRVALILQRFGLLPQGSRITLLDTPMPDVTDIQQLMQPIDGGEPRCQIDYYKSSFFAQGVPVDKKWPNYRCYELTPSVLPGRDPGALNDHSYAHQWFIQTILGTPKENPGPPGFRCSPFMPKSS